MSISRFNAVEKECLQPEGNAEISLQGNVQSLDPRH